MRMVGDLLASEDPAFKMHPKPQVTSRFLVLPEMIGPAIIGKGGTHAKHIKERTGVRIEVVRECLCWLAGCLRGRVLPATPNSKTTEPLRSRAGRLRHTCHPYSRVVLCSWCANPSAACCCLPSPPLLLFVWCLVQLPRQPTSRARRLCCTARLSVCVRPTTCCWATSASTGPQTCPLAQCPTHCPLDGAVHAGESTPTKCVLLPGSQEVVWGTVHVWWQPCGTCCFSSCMRPYVLRRNHLL